MNNKSHWESVYRRGAPDQVSWYQADPEPSLRLIRQAIPEDAALIDVGGGASTLVDTLTSLGYYRVTVLDLSSTALAAARTRLGGRSARVTWVEGDVLDTALPAGGFDLWHDRAVFHFLVDAPDRLCYVRQLRRALASDGHVVIATFAPDGPARCSGLEVARYSPEELHRELGPEFRILSSLRHEHRTPGGRTQAFTHCLFRR